MSEEDVKIEQDVETVPAKLPETAGVVDESVEDADGGGLGFKTYLVLGIGGLLLVMVLVLLIGGGISLIGDPEVTAVRVGMIRDVFIILIALEFIMVIVALAILIMQVVRLIAMLRDEIKPILENTRETVDTAKGTAQFVGKNVTRPVISTSAFLAGALTFMREIGGIRRAIRHSDKPEELSDDGE